jgi:hypothetical protein
MAASKADRKVDQKAASRADQRAGLWENSWAVRKAASKVRQ